LQLFTANSPICIPVNLYGTIKEKNYRENMDMITGHHLSSLLSGCEVIASMNPPPGAALAQAMAGLPEPMNEPQSFTQGGYQNSAKGLTFG
jgi:hypothetical protein